jgi:hypothetical protein
LYNTEILLTEIRRAGVSLFLCAFYFLEQSFSSARRRLALLLLLLLSRRLARKQKMEFDAQKVA